MLKQYYLYDNNYIYIKPIIVNDTEIMSQCPVGDYAETAALKKKLDNSTVIKPPDGLYRAKYDPVTETWSEAATREEIDAILLAGLNQEPTENQVLGQMYTDLEIKIFQLEAKLNV